MPQPELTRSGYDWSVLRQPPGVKAVESRGHRKRPRMVKPPPPGHAGASWPSAHRMSSCAPLCWIRIPQNGA